MKTHGYQSCIGSWICHWMFSWSLEKRYYYLVGSENGMYIWFLILLFQRFLYVYNCVNTSFVN